MQIVIDIDDESYKEICLSAVSNAEMAIKNGIILPEKHGDIIDRGFMLAKLLDEILVCGVKTPMDCIDFIKNYKITIPATEGFTPYFCQTRLPDKEERGGEQKTI